ncbi:unnamed protein product [Arctogadus glacialis]
MQRSGPLFLPQPRPTPTQPHDYPSPLPVPTLGNQSPLLASSALGVIAVPRQNVSRVSTYTVKIQRKNNGDARLQR